MHQQNETRDLTDHKLAQLLAYLEEGMHLLPCRRHSKVAATAHGVKDASNDPATVRRWHRRWPHANWAMACGRSGRVVVDIDPRNMDDPGSLEEICDRHELPDTMTVATPNG